MKKKSGINPFYWALVVVGTVFAITACAYAVMAVRKLDPLAGDEGGLVGFMADHGVTLVMSELALLTVLTFAAIGLDDYFTGEGNQDGGGVREGGVVREGEAPAEPTPQLTGAINPSAGLPSIPYGSAGASPSQAVTSPSQAVTAPSQEKPSKESP